MVYVSVRGRIWLQAEAMNMVESVGNYVKHRKVPVMVKEDGSHLTFFVPAISGESVAHAYQVMLAEEMIKAGQSVCPFCAKGIFL
jgi:CRISPR-associated autoregulator, Csa2 family